MISHVSAPESYTATPLGWVALGIFAVAYLCVIFEELTRMPKSKPVLLGASLMWILVAILAKESHASEWVAYAIKQNILEYAELLLFLLVAMMYINTLEERNVFDALRIYLIKRGCSYRQLFWLTGSLAFILSPIADNLTTALVLCSVVLAVGKNLPIFIQLSCINIVVAANAGGAFSPFGDITTLMVWQKGILPFQSFFKLFIPALVSFIVPALCLDSCIPRGRPPVILEDPVLKKGALAVIGLFALTILTAIILHHALHLPPVVGMMTGLGYLQLWSYTFKSKIIQKIDWDTLLFFYGIMLCVGALSALGFLECLNTTLYQSWPFLPANFEQTPANISVGLLSALIDNIPMMYAILSMAPQMGETQWLLVTLTTGIGGSLLAIGSAAGVALMGHTQGIYSFSSHLKWSWAVLLGYIAAIGMHLMLSGL